MSDKEVKVTIAYGQHTVVRVFKVGDLEQCLRENKSCHGLTAVDELPLIFEDMISRELVRESDDGELYRPCGMKPKGLYEMCWRLIHKIKQEVG